MKNIIKITTFIILSALLLTACSAEKDPLAFCKKLDQQKVEKLINSSYKMDNVTNLAEGYLGCKYTSETIEGKTFNIIANQTSYPQEAQQAYERTIDVWKNSTVPDREFSDLTTVGDAGFWAYNKVTPQLVTYRDTKLLIITLGNFNLDEQQEKDITIEIANSLFDQRW